MTTPDYDAEAERVIKNVDTVFEIGEEPRLYYKEEISAALRRAHVAGLREAAEYLAGRNSDTFFEEAHLKRRAEEVERQ